MKCRSGRPRRDSPHSALAAAWASRSASKLSEPFRYLHTPREDFTVATRVALVTGGTRGIGKAISVALKNAGRKVVANYGGNDEAAKAFEAETGISTYKFDVGDFAAVSAAVKKI